MCRAQLRLHGILPIFETEWLQQLHSNTFITAWHTIYVTLSTIDWLAIDDCACMLIACIELICLSSGSCVIVPVEMCMKNSMEYTAQHPTYWLTLPLIA